MTTLYHAHSGLRYLVILAAIAALVALAYALATNRAVRAAQRLSTAFTGLLDVQILLGVALFFSGVFPDVVVGHLVCMVLAAAATHGSSIVGRRSSDERRELVIRLGGILLALVLIAVGIMAIGRGVFESRPLAVR